MTTENDLYRDLLETATRVRRTDEKKSPRPVTDYKHLVREATWRQAWDAEKRKLGEPHKVNGIIWSDAIERCLEENNSVYIPEMAGPVYIDRSIVLKSDQRLIAAPGAEIRMIIGEAGTCMVRNANVKFSQDRPVKMCDGADDNILIEGGAWSDQNCEGLGRGGQYDLENSMPGAHAIFLLHNITRLAVRNVRFRDCSPFAVQLGNARDFVIENIKFDETADGIHVEGPSARGIIRHISGKTNDDQVALNAWDWDNSSITFGPITDMLVEDVECRPGYTWSEFRLLPGTKRFRNGQSIACDIRRCVYRNIRGVHTFKMYDQPNLSKPEEDFADPIGKMSDMFFSNITVDGIAKSGYYDKSSEGVFDICADIDNISINDVRFNYVPGTGEMAPCLVTVGPKALTWPRSKAPGSGWKEVFNPNAKPVVKNLSVKNIQAPDPDKPGKYMRYKNADKLIKATRLSLSPDFPKTMPRGGMGKGKIVEAVID